MKGMFKRLIVEAEKSARRINQAVLEDENYNALMMCALRDPEDHNGACWLMMAGDSWDMVSVISAMCEHIVQGTGIDREDLLKEIWDTMKKYRDKE